VSLKTKLMAKRSKNKRVSSIALPPEPASLPQTVEIRKILPVKPAPISWKVLVQALLIVAAGFWIYWPALQGDWLWDDDLLVTDNSRLRSFLGLWDIWFAAPTTYYWPLTWTLLWTEWHLWGNVPLGYHVCSLVLHLSSAFLIWRLFHRLGLRFGWLGGLLFVVHPLVVESVAWISEIKNTLSLPFFLLSCGAWLNAEEKKPSGYLRSVLYYLAAMLAKSSTIMLPAVLLLYCWWKRGRVTRQEITRLIPYGAIALMLGLATVCFQDTGNDPNALEPGGFVARSIGVGTALFVYLGKFVLPVDLLPIYPRWALDSPSLFEVLTLPLLAGVLFGLWTQRKGWGRHVVFGFGFFLLNLLPVLLFMMMKYETMIWSMDHLVYVSIIGLIGLVVAGMGKLGDMVPSSLRLYGMGAVAMVMAWLAWQSHGYAGRFIDQETLWTYTLQLNSEAWVAHNGLGNVLVQKKRVPEAIEQFEWALKIKPDDAEAHNNLGNALVQAGRTSEATEQFEQALKLNPKLAGAHGNWGNALMQAGRVREAMEQYEQALKLEPDSADAHYNLGNALVQAGHIPESMEQYEQALAINPDLVDAHSNWGNALLQTGRVPEAIDQFELALKLRPGSADVHYNLGFALLQTGRSAEAIDQFEQALKINPNYAEAHGNLGVALFQIGHTPEAVEQFEQALKINPDYADARNNLAKVQALEKAGPAKK